MHDQSLNGVRVLVIDDDLDCADLIKVALAPTGAQVTAVGTADLAFASISEQKPDVILTDLSLPDMDGLSLIRTLRSRPSSQGGAIPAIALTGRADLKETVLRAGFQAYVTKPCELDDLILLVRSWARR